MKNCKIVRIGGIDLPPAVEPWIKKNLYFETNTYNEILELLFDYKVMCTDGFSRCLNELGQDAHEIIADFEILQKQWAKENDVKFGYKSWMIDILLAQIKTIRPDVIYLQGTEWTIPGRFFPLRNNDNLIKILKEEYPFIKKVIIYSGYPGDMNRLYHADFLFSASPNNLSSYKNQGLDSYIPSELMYHSFDESILQKLNETEKKYDFSFVGTSRAPETRYWALRQLLEQTDLKVWIYRPPHKIHAKAPKESIKLQVRSALKRGFELFGDHQVNALADSNLVPGKFRHIFLQISRHRKIFEGNMLPKGPATELDELYPDRCHPSVMGRNMYNVLHQSRITFDKHADAGCGNVGNMRMFEATGVGTCLLTDNGSNMQDLFEPDKEVVVYSSIDDAVEKVTYLLDHPGEAEQIAKAGQTRTLKDHTIMNRCQQIDACLKEL